MLRLPWSWPVTAWRKELCVCVFFDDTRFDLETKSASVLHSAEVKVGPGSARSPAASGSLLLPDPGVFYMQLWTHLYAGTGRATAQANCP